MGQKACWLIVNVLPDLESFGVHPVLSLNHRQALADSHHRVPSPFPIERPSASPFLVISIPAVSVNNHYKYIQ